MNKISKAIAPLRSSEWWESKFGPLFGIIYATSLLLNIPLLSLFPFLAFLLIALIPGASFVSLINDLTDLEEDKLVGKKNRLEGHSTQTAIILILICLGFGVLISFFLTKVSFCLYLSAWLIFSFYSLPPIRLKQRGIWGVLADTLGANVFPQLFSIAVLFEWFNKDLDIWWFGLIALWTFLHGLRGIVSHQLIDRKNDEVAGIKTFVQNYQNLTIKRIFTWLIFPLEIICLVLLINYSGNIYGFVLLGIYFLLVLLIHSIWEIRYVVVTQSVKERLLMNEFYFLLFPVSFLLAGLMIFSSSWIVIILHLAFFYQSLFKFISELIRLLSEIKLIVREFLLGY